MKPARVNEAASGDEVPARPNSFRSAAYASWLLMVVVWLVFLWPALSGHQQFGFRDTGSLYFPMFRWIDRQWESGRTPYWNPLDDFGVSVAGDTSSSLFYPGKVVFMARSFSFDLRFAWYVSLHVLLAAVGGWFAARSIGCRPVASSLAGISYALGGPVLFQTCNVVFLVGSAWLPFTLAAVWRWSKTNRNAKRWLILAAISLAMMVLGGDPQMAFMAGLAAIAVLGTNPGLRSVRERWVAPFVISFGGMALSGVQILASLNWLSTSERSGNSPSASIWGALLHGDFSSLIGEPKPGTHAAAVYEFSFAPWRIVESIWPNVLGKLDFVSESVWASQLPGADRLWTPSIYLGVVVLLLAVERMRWRRATDAADTSDRQLTWLMTFFLVGSFGWYGLGWLINELQLMRGGYGIGNEIGMPVGGLYWWLVTLLPGVSSFRYPAKLLTIAALATCLLGGRGFDSLISGSARNAVRRLTRRAVGVGVTGGLFATLILMVGNQQIGLSPDAAVEVLTALVHSTVVLGVFCLVLHLRGSFTDSARPWLILCLCAGDLYVANHCLSGFVPAGDTVVAQNNETGTIYRNPEIDQPFVHKKGSLSLADVCRLDRMTSRPRLHWQSNHRVIGSFASIEQLDVLAWKQAIHQLDESRRKVILESCGVEQTIDSIQRKDQPSGKTLFTIHRTHPDGLSHFRLVDSWSVISEIDNLAPQAVVNRTNEVLELQIANGPEWVVIESNQSPLPRASSSHSDRPGQITIVSEESTRIVLDVDAEQDCLLLATDYFCPSWSATISSNTTGHKPVTILRANRLLRAIPVSAGQSRLTLQYRIPGFRAGIAVSLLAWLGAVLFLFHREPSSKVLR